MAILQDQTKAHEQVAMLAELAALKAENARLKAAKATNGLKLKVSEKGAVSIYGMGRFPVTLYASQWKRLFKAQSEIETFILENMAQLKTKEGQS